MRLRPGDTADDAPPDSLVGWGGDTPSPYLNPRRLRRRYPRTFGARQSATPHCFLTNRTLQYVAYVKTTHTPTVNELINQSK